MSLAAPRLLHGSFRTLVTGQCLGQGADGLAQIAFAQFIVFEAGRGASPARIASLLAVTLLPFSLVGPFAGVLIDRWSRRRVLVIVSWLRALLVLAAAGTVISGSQPAAYTCVLLLLSTSRFVLAAKGASIPRTVPADDLVSANAISAVAGMSATFAGAVGGATFVGRSSLAGFGAAAVLYVAAGAVFTRLHGVGGGSRGRDVARRLRHALLDVRDGLRAVRRPEIGRPLSAVWLHRLLLGAGFVVLVLVADSRFHLQVAGYGLALAVTGVAAFAGSVAAPACARRWRPEALLAASFVPPAAAVYAGGMFPNLVVLVLAVAVTSLCFQLLKVVVDAMVGGASPDAVRGRVFSVYDVLYNVAFVLAGLLMVPLWGPDRVTALLWWLAAAFATGWVLYARLFRIWPFRPSHAPVADRRWRGRVLALALGALPVLAFPAPAWWWLAWIVLVPLLLHLRSAPTAREAALRGWWAGAGYLSATSYWLLPVAGPALLLIGFALGALWLPWGWTARRMLGPPAGPGTALAATAVLPSLWVLIEAARSWQGLGGPWALLGATQWNQARLLASAALGGVWLTGFLVVAVNVALVGMLTVRTARRRTLLAAVAVTALAVGPAWAAAGRSPAPAGTTRVAAVQLPSMLPGAARLDAQIRLTERLAASDPDLVVWGESSVAYDLRRRPDVVRRLVDLARRTGADLLVNVDARRETGQIYKTSELVTPSGVDGSYTKTRLVPFGEYIPLRRVLGWVADVSKAAPQNRGRGTGPVVLHSDRLAFGPLICFESTFPDLARAEARLGADLIVYQTADTTFQGTWEQPQQASLAAVRAVETGRPVVQVALTGTTAAYDATGHRLAWLGAGRTATAVRTLTLTRGLTPFDTAGSWVLAVAVAVVATALVVGSLGTARRRRSRPVDAALPGSSGSAGEPVENLAG